MELKVVGTMQWLAVENMLHPVTEMDIPSCPGVYQWRMDNKIIKIGSTKNLHTRLLKQHMSKSMYNSPDRMKRDRTSRKIRLFFDDPKNQLPIIVEIFHNSIEIYDPTIDQILNVSPIKEYENYLTQKALEAQEPLTLMTQKKA